MEIIELNSLHTEDFNLFKSEVWLSADKEHYGTNQPKFYKTNFTFIARKNSIIVGYISVVIDTGVAQIEPLMVKPSLQGQGIGTELLRYTENKIKTLGVHKIWLETGYSWLAKNFYLKNGYSVRTTLPNHTNQEDFVLMDKMI